ncbi:DNA-binding transcriptional LysR family regulator [Kribbella antiqua]|uniref:DNA-binding transcriptional LysR family regulator n=1 Tax=Kribbella antiqua TaxID=2512217 RepID=A0A4R2ISL2_9ACTN|nr:LysR family transcriptional regulator [Kribbella antiqua]TCO47486.1 DNA-binding transcriptional LysR family regulator [Kribbella antiqua]
MELRQLEYFVAVAHERSFTLAARRLHVVQSAVSAAIAALERDLKVTLFERSAQRVVLTEAGTALLPEALAVMDAVQGARDVVDELRTGLRGSVRVGLLPGLGLIDLPAAAGEFRRRHQNVELQLRVEPEGSAGVIVGLRNGDIDVGFLGIAPGSAPSDLTTWELLRVPQVLAVPAGHRLERRRSVTVPDLADEAFVDFPPGFGTRTLIDQKFEATGIQRRVVVEALGIENGVQFVTHGVGLGILPEYAVAGIDGIRAVPIVDESFQWSLYMATLKKRKPTAALRALLALVSRHLKQPPGTELGQDVDQQN